MSALRLGNAIFGTFVSGRGALLAHNRRRAMIVRRHRLMLRQTEQPATETAGSPDALIDQLPSSLVGE